MLYRGLVSLSLRRLLFIETKLYIFSGTKLLNLAYVTHHMFITAHAACAVEAFVVSYYKSSSVCLFVCLSVCSLSPPRSFDRSSPNLVGVCRWTSELPLRGSFSKRSTARRVNGSLSLSTILYMCQPHSTQLQKATLLLLQLIRLKGTFCCIDGWWVYVGGSRN